MLAPARRAPRFAIFRPGCQKSLCPNPAFPRIPSRFYWRRNLRLIALLLALWAGLTFIPSYFARGLSFDFLNWPFSYWMAAYARRWPT